MATPSPSDSSVRLTWSQPSVVRVACLLVIIALVIVGLHLGRDLLLPLALAALLALLLDPLVVALRRWWLPRGAAVALVVVCTSGVLGATTLFIGSQVAALGRDLPAYQHQIRDKLAGLRASLTGGGAFDGASRVIDLVERELNAARQALDKPPEASADKGAGAPADKPGTARAQAQDPRVAAAKPPLRVQLEAQPAPPMRALGDLIAPVLMPLVTAGLVLVFLVFILLERHELRDRVLRLVGGDLHRSTDALNEAAHRVSRYLALQLLVNLGYGLPLALGLWFIGVPGALVWGLLAAVLRFVPYVGPVIAALFPLTLAFAVDAGWGMLVQTVLLVLVLELISNNLVEPWLYGRSTGISAVAVLVSASFWALVWGPAGLVLATPLTVCLVVMGRHLAPLRFLDLLLGSRPVFDPATRLYQRLIAGDIEEASELTLAHAAEHSPLDFYDRVGLPMLALAEAPPEGMASQRQRQRLLRGTSLLLQELQEEHPPAAADGSAAQVLCIGGRSELDTLAARMLAQGLTQQGHAARALPAQALSAEALSAERIAALQLDRVHTVCLSYLGPEVQTHLRYVCRRLRRRRPELRILLVPWHEPLAPGDGGPDASARSVGEVLALLQPARDTSADASQAAAQPPDAACARYSPA